MTEERQWKRIRERLELSLPIRVRGRETRDFEWVEVTRLTNVTPFGAAFPLKRPTETGRLLQLTIPMPRQLRVFDHVEEQYRVWALVRHLKAITSANPRGSLFDIGVAFVGKRPPVSYHHDPTTLYGASSNAPVSAVTIEPIVRPLLSADQRIHTRHNIAVDLQLEVLDEMNEVNQAETTVSENISKQGATVFTTISVPVGRFVRLISTQPPATLYAVVRARSTGKDGIHRIHVEFVGREWPL